MCHLTRLVGEVPHLHVKAKERVVGEEAVAAGSRHHVAAQGRVAVWVLGLQQGRWPVQHLIHVTAHPVQWQVVCNL